MEEGNLEANGVECVKLRSMLMAMHHPTHKSLTSSFPSDSASSQCASESFLPTQQALGSATDGRAGEGHQRKPEPSEVEERQNTDPTQGVMSDRGPAAPVEQSPVSPGALSGGRVDAVTVDNAGIYALQSENAELRRLLDDRAAECQRLSDNNKRLLERLDETEELTNRLLDACAFLKDLVDKRTAELAARTSTTASGASTPLSFSGSHKAYVSRRSGVVTQKFLDSIRARIVNAVSVMDAFTDNVRDGTLHEREHVSILSVDSPPDAQPDTVTDEKDSDTDLSHHYAQCEESVAELDRSIARLEAEVGIQLHQHRASPPASSPRKRITSTDATTSSLAASGLATPPPLTGAQRPLLAAGSPSPWTRLRAVQERLLAQNDSHLWAVQEGRSPTAPIAALSQAPHSPDSPDRHRSLLWCVHELENALYQDD